jgi:hypothetical protein
MKKQVTKEEYYKGLSTKELESQLNVLLSMDNNGGMLANDIIAELLTREDRSDDTPDKTIKKSLDLLKSGFEIDIEKAEGSRGGRIIGHTKSGKPIYHSSTTPSEAYGNFTKQDHLEAAAAHKERISIQYGGSKANLKEDPYVKHHTSESKWHEGEAANFVEKSEQDDDIEKGKSFPIGTVHNGFKKIKEGVWKKVSEGQHRTKKEHLKIVDSLKEEAKNPQGSEIKYNAKHPSWEEARKHYDIADKLDDKDYSDADVMGGEKEDKISRGEAKIAAKDQGVIIMNNKFYSRSGNEMEPKRSNGRIFFTNIKKSQTTMDTQELIDEHKKLVNTLESPSHEDDKKEAEEQKKELKQYEDKVKKNR